jgi:hypothetical protein
MKTIIDTDLLEPNVIEKAMQIARWNQNPSLRAKV